MVSFGLSSDQKSEYPALSWPPQGSALLPLQVLTVVVAICQTESELMTPLHGPDMMVALPSWRSWLPWTPNPGWAQVVAAPIGGGFEPPWLQFPEQ